MPPLSKYNTAPGNVSLHVQFPDGVEHSARMIPLGTSHLCPPCMTVDGKTYGGAGRGVVCVRWEEGTERRHASKASPGVTMVAGWHLQSGILWTMLAREAYCDAWHRGRGTLSEWPSHLNTMRELPHLKRQTLWKKKLFTFQCWT